jgi:hypothetical protein
MQDPPKATPHADRFAVLFLTRLTLSSIIFASIGQVTIIPRSERLEVLLTRLFQIPDDFVTNLLWSLHESNLLASSGGLEVDSRFRDHPGLAPGHSTSVKHARRDVKDG